MNRLPWCACGRAKVVLGRTCPKGGTCDACCLGCAMGCGARARDDQARVEDLVDELGLVERDALAGETEVERLRAEVDRLRAEVRRLNEEVENLRALAQPEMLRRLKEVTDSATDMIRSCMDALNTDPEEDPRG